MSVAHLRASRALWRRREVYRYRKWAAAKSRNDSVARTKWWKLYAEARDMRRHRDSQLAHAHGNAHSVSKAGVDLVASFEGFRSHPYRDAVGVWTIGYGETRYVGPNTTPISEEQAKALLRARLDHDYVPAVLAASRSKLTQNQLDGFASFVYNVGVGGVAASTQVGRYLRAGNVRAAADAILAWDKAGGHALAGLTRRRHAERSLILR